MSIKCYTRASIGNWIHQNSRARHLRQSLHDYQFEYNGMIRYSDFSPSDTMTSYSVKRDKVNDFACFLIPPKEELTSTFFKRIKLFNKFARDYD